LNDFEFLFALFGPIVAELSLKFADAIDAQRERPMEILTPALAFLLLTVTELLALRLVGAEGADGHLVRGLLGRAAGHSLFRRRLAGLCARCRPLEKPRRPLLGARAPRCRRDAVRGPDDRRGDADAGGARLGTTGGSISISPATSWRLPGW
jgi:hypothetical protein